MPKIKSPFKILARLGQTTTFHSFTCWYEKNWQFYWGELFTMKAHVGVSVEGENSTDVTLSARIPNTNFFLHTSRYSNNHTKRTCSRFWSMCYFKTSPKLPPHISVPTGTATSLQEHPSHVNSLVVGSSSPNPDFGIWTRIGAHRWSSCQCATTLLALLYAHKMSLEEDCALFLWLCMKLRSHIAS